jgi:hypothetical protein
VFKIVVWYQTAVVRQKSEIDRRNKSFRKHNKIIDFQSKINRFNVKQCESIINKNKNRKNRRQSIVKREKNRFATIFFKKPQKQKQKTYN